MTNSDDGRELSIMVAVNGAIDELHHSLGLHESVLLRVRSHRLRRADHADAR